MSTTTILLCALILFDHCLKGIDCLNILRNHKASSRINRRVRYCTMDDETQRIGIKDDLTTRDEYLATRFSRLSSSGHDLTSLTSEEISEWDDHHEEYSNRNIVKRTINSFLGYLDKGIYVSRIGGLPLFTSGYRLDASCTEEMLVFTEPCDPEHIYLADWNGTFPHLRDSIMKTFPSVGQVQALFCVRSGLGVGVQASVDGSDDDRQLSFVYVVDANSVIFLSLDRSWPIESQPENIWGTEGQYLAYKQQENLS